MILRTLFFLPVLNYNTDTADSANENLVGVSLPLDILVESVFFILVRSLYGKVSVMASWSYRSTYCFSSTM